MFETLIFILVCLTYLLFRKKQNHWKKKGVPFEKPLPFIGNIGSVLLLRKTIGEKINELYAKFDERYFGMWVFGEPQLVIKCPELIKSILIRDFNHFYDRNVACSETADPVSARMMFFMRNPQWKDIRTKTTPIFTSGRMKYIFPNIQKIAKEMVSFINARKTTDIDIKEISLKYSTDVICSSAFGVDAYSFQEKETQFTKVGKTVFGITLQNAIAAMTYFTRSSLVDIFKIKFMKAQTSKFLTEVFLDIMKERELVESDRRDLIDILIKLKKEHDFDDLDLISQACQFFLAGFETTSSTVSFVLYELALNEDVQAKLRKEILCHVDDEGDFSYNDIHEMAYLDKVISETLRKYPILPFLGRLCMQDYKIPDGDLVIEKGTCIMISLLGLHHDPKYFPDPQKFDPERFSEENINQRKPYVYLPFGDGQRNCIGQRMALVSTKLAVCHIIKNFKLGTSDKTSIPLKFSPRTFTVHIDGGIYVTLKQI